MKFEYDTPEEDKGTVVAELFHMEHSPKDICLNIYHNGRGDTTVTTIYYDGQTTAQKPFSVGGCSIKKFYKGDKITIAF